MFICSQLLVILQHDLAALLPTQGTGQSRACGTTVRWT